MRWTVRAFQRTFSSQVAYVVGRENARNTAAAVAVICPLVSSSLSDRAQSLEVAALDFRGAGDAFRLAVSSLFANWRSDPAVSTATAESVRINSRWRIPAVLDGEVVHFEHAIEVRFAPKLFTALVPGNRTNPEGKNNVKKYRAFSTSDQRDS
jgi:diacylglycerol kinase family enzyme